jgi:diguanylate cyclase (GGDEF)-like protein
MTEKKIGSSDRRRRAQLDDAVRAEQVRMLMHRRVDLPMNLLLAVLVWGTLRRLYPGWIGLSWLELFSLVILARFVSRRLYRAQDSATGIAPTWGRVFAVNAFVTALLWGLTGTAILMTPNPVYHLFVVFVLGGLTAAGIVSNSAYLPAMWSFTIPTVLPVLVILSTRPDMNHIEMSGMMVMFTLVLIASGLNINRSIVENFRLRLGQEMLSIKQRDSEAAMVEAQAMAHVGSWNIDLVARNYFCSLEAYRIFGVDPTKIKPSYDSMLARIHADDRSGVAKDIAETVASGKGRGIDHRLVMDDGTIKHVHEQARVTHDARGRALRMIGTVQDITESKIAEAKLQFANLLFTTEMEASPDGVLVVGANREIISANSRFCEIWKLPRTTLAGERDEKILASGTALVKDPQHFAEVVRQIYEHPGEASHDEFEMTDGRFIERHTVMLKSSQGQLLGRIWFFRDITASKQAAAHALRLARFDVLTGLANREVFVEALQHAVARAKRTANGFAVIYLDLDHFKDVNDTLGHPVGDELLQAVADRLESNTRESDTVARFGGDEFAVVVGDVEQPSDAAILAEKLIHALGQPYSIQGNEIFSAASIGIDVYGREAPDAETLLSHADVALYRAKAEGRDMYRFFTPAMDTEVRMQVTLGTELHEALDAGQLFLMYQPQVTVDDAHIVGLEALVRWRHPRRGILDPEVFIPVAEKMGMIVKLGHWVLLTACRQAKIWLDAGMKPIRIAVNLSALQFKSPIGLEADIAEVLAETAPPPQLLELELTETILMETFREHSDIVERLRKLGVTIAIDDFGTGYSSLDYLRRFPADRIKIAQDFVRHLETTPSDAIIVKATIGLARELGIPIITEGVETREQLELVKGWGCGEVQGFYFSKPLAVEDVSRVLGSGGFLSPANHSLASSSSAAK